METRLPRLLALLLMLSLLLSLAATAADPDSYEIPNDWSHDAFVFAVENDILRGDHHMRLNPQKNITRAEMAAVLVRLIGATQQGNLSAFSDVDPNAWYYPELSAAYAAGIFGGVTATQMMPNAFITREQAFVALCRAFGIVSANRTAYTAFTDGNKTSAYARDSLSAMKELGLLRGYGDGSVRPLAYITRAEIAQLLYNLFDCIADAPDELPASGTVLYRGTQKLPDMLTLDGTLIITQAAPAVFTPVSWQITGSLILRTGKNTNANLSAVSAKQLVCAPLSGSVSGKASEVCLWGASSSFTGNAGRLIVCGGSHSFTGASNAINVRAGTLTHNGNTGDVTLDGSTTLVLNGNAGNITANGDNTALTVNGRAASITLNGGLSTVNGTGSAGTITICKEQCTVTLKCDKLNDLLYQAEHDAALQTVRTMRIPCTVKRATAIYKNRDFTGYIRSLPAGTIVYNQYHPDNNTLYVSLGDGTWGWVPRWDCYIPDDAVTTDGKLDYSKATKEGFVDLCNYNSKTDYLIWVSRYTQKVMVFQGKQGAWKLIRTFPCSTGSNDTPTPQGIFEIFSRTQRWNFSYYYVNNVSIFNGGHAFHTILLDYGGGVYDGRVGIPLSHGCIRMLPEDCKYIYNLPMNTRVVVY